MTDSSLYPVLLGPDYWRLPAIIQDMHRLQPHVEAEGFGTVTHGGNPVARRFARFLRFPAAGVDRPLQVRFVEQDGVERLSRHYPDATLTTWQRPAGPPGSGLLAESFGPFNLVIRLDASESGLGFRLMSVRLAGIALPKWLSPRLDARESVQDDWYVFKVQIDLPFLGRLIRYEGRLRRRVPPQ